MLDSTYGNRSSIYVAALFVDDDFTTVAAISSEVENVGLLPIKIFHFDSMEQPQVLHTQWPRSH